MMQMNLTETTKYLNRKTHVTWPSDIIELVVPFEWHLFKLNATYTTLFDVRYFENDIMKTKFS